MYQWSNSHEGQIERADDGTLRVVRASNTASDIFSLVLSAPDRWRLRRWAYDKEGQKPDIVFDVGRDGEIEWAVEGGTLVVGESEAGEIAQGVLGSACFQLGYFLYGGIQHARADRTLDLSVDAVSSDAFRAVWNSKLFGSVVFDFERADEQLRVKRMAVLNKGYGFRCADWKHGNGRWVAQAVTQVFRDQSVVTQLRLESDRPLQQGVAETWCAVPEAGSKQVMRRGHGPSEITDVEDRIRETRFVVGEPGLRRWSEPASDSHDSATPEATHY